MQLRNKLDAIKVKYNNDFLSLKGLLDEKNSIKDNIKQL